MPELKVKEKKVLEVDHNDLDRFINEVYGLGHRYECVAFEEWNNSESHSFVIKKEPLDDYDGEQLEEFIGGNNRRGMYLLSTILTDLCNKGLIEEGEYLVDVFW